MASNAAWYGVGLGGIIFIVVFVFLITHLRQAKKKSKLEASRLSPSSFDSESKTKMMSRLDKRESKLRRERILEGGTLPELNELIVYYPARNEKITSKEVDVRGKTTVKSIVWINNQAAFVDLDGSFIGTVKLFKGKNTLDLVVIGPYGRAMKTSIPVQCTAKDAPSTSPYKYILPQHTLDIKIGTTTDMPPGHERPAISLPSLGSTMGESSQPTSYADPIVVSESEIDPSVLAALKGESFADESPMVGAVVNLDELEPEAVVETPVSEAEIPPIPDITGPEEEVSLPPIPSVEKEEEPVVEEEPPVIDEDLAESVKLLEEVVDEKEATFEPDKMLPKQPGEKAGAAPDTKEESLSEFAPLKTSQEQLKELIIETKKQELDDERKTVILQHIGLLRTAEGELLQVLKFEKRIECVLEKWYSTLGFVNVSDKELKRVKIKEYISDTVEFTGKIPDNVEEPVVEQLPEGVQLTWVINDFKPQMKIFITYNEKVNPLQILKQNQIQPKVTILS